MELLTRTQQEAVEEFFERNPNESPDRCNDYASKVILPLLVPVPSVSRTKVVPNDFQGAFSYTCAIMEESKPTFVVQFREKEQDLKPIQHAHEIHAPFAPEVRYWNTFGSLHVYTSPFIQGKPCIYALIDADFDASTQPLFKQTVSDLARFLTGDARSGDDNMLDAVINRIEQKLDHHKFKNRKLLRQIRRCIEAVRNEESLYPPLPHVFAHQDLGPYNFLVDDTTGKISATLDWDDAKSDVVGRNFHFVDHFLGVMTPGGWYSNKNQDLDDIFYTAVLQCLSTQGFPEITRPQLAAQKTIGALEYHLFRKEKVEERRERYLDWYSSPTA